MLIAWHPRRWWNFCMPEDKEKEKKISMSNAFSMYAT